MCAAEFYGQLVTALTFGCVFPLCVIFKVVFFTTRCVENKSCSRQKGDITEPLLQRKSFVKSIYVIFISFSFAIIRHKIILQNNHSEIETSILSFHQFHVTTK